MGPFTTLLVGGDTRQASCQYVLYAASLYVGCRDAVADEHATDESRAFAEAVLLYRVRRWSAAYNHFKVLADRGHVRAARIALAMQREGEEAYGTNWIATSEQLLEWQHTAGREPLTH
jgi:hypothetical protein